MPYTILLKDIPAGYAMDSARKGERLAVITREFTSSEDGDIFTSRLEGIPSIILSQLPADAEVAPSTIDHLVAIIERDKTATVYINELPMLTTVRLKRDIDKGERITEDDIADIEAVEFSGIDVSDEAGVVVVLSRGWRKALYYDLTPLHEPYPRRKYPLWELLGYYFTYLSFQHLFKITEPQWERLLNEQWFPFARLKHSTVRRMLECIRAGWSVDDLTEQIATEVDQALDTMSARWATSTVLAPHMTLLNRAIERYRDGDFISSTAILYPRIEGVVRTLYEQSGGPQKATQQHLAGVPLMAYQTHPGGYSLLLPHKFKTYIEKVYFANFVPGQPAPLSRNSVSHGVAAPEDFSRKAATIGLLIMDQIFYHIRPAI